MADEVRNLAIRAADAAKDTAGLIEDTVIKVKGGADIVSRTNTDFGQVKQSAESVSQLVAEIAAASGEQAQGIGQINTAVTEMDKVTQQVAANAEESASASEEMSAQAVQMKEVAGQLAAMVNGTSQKRKDTNALTTIEEPSLSEFNRHEGAPLHSKKTALETTITERHSTPLASQGKEDFSDF